MSVFCLALHIVNHSVVVIMHFQVQEHTISMMLHHHTSDSSRHQVSVTLLNGPLHCSVQSVLLCPMKSFRTDNVQVACKQN
jgi:hypothetical protein